MTVSWKLFWSVLGAVLALTLAVPLALLRVWWVAPRATTPAVTTLVTLLIAVAAAGVAVGIAAFMARQVVTRGKIFAKTTAEARASIARWVTVAPAAYGLWVVVFALGPALWPWWLLALVALSAGTYGLARSHDYLLTLAPPPPKPAQSPATAEPRDKTRAIFNAAMNRAGFDRVGLVKYKPVGGAEPYGVKFFVRTPSDMLQPNGKNRATALTKASAEPIAIALSEVLRQPLDTDWVSVQKERTAGMWTVTVVTQDVMARIHPYRDPLQWSSITVPKMVGYQLDGDEYHLPLNQHGQAIGKSTGGKSSFLNVLFAELSLCEDAIIWVAGVEKLYDLVSDWVEPYAGTDEPLPFDWIGHGQKDTLDILIGAMNAARWRQHQPNHKRGGWPEIVVVLDEASDAAQNRDVVGIYNGRQVTVSMMMAKIVQRATSAGVRLVLATQRGTDDHKGDEGGDTRTNIGWTAAFQTNDRDDIGRLFNDWTLSIPRHRGQYWLNANNGDGPVNLKAPYPQATDPSKSKLHDGPTVRDIAWSRRRFRRQLDPGTAAAVGAAYERRHTRMTPEFMQYLTNAVDLTPLKATPQDEGAAAALRDIELAKQRAAQALPAAETTPAEAVAAPPPPTTRPELIIRIVEDADGKPVPRKDIVAALKGLGDDPHPQVVTNALTDLVNKKKLTRSTDGSGYVVSAVDNAAA